MYLPGVEALELLPRELGITADEIIAANRRTTNENAAIAEDEKGNKETELRNPGKKAASCAFTQEERMEYFKKKWLRDHVFENVCSIVGVLIVALLLSKYLEISCPAAFFVMAAVCVVMRRNNMMGYAEERVFSMTLSDAEEKDNASDDMTTL